MSNDDTNLRYDFRCFKFNDAQNGRYIKVQSTWESLNETKLFFGGFWPAESNQL